MTLIRGSTTVGEPAGEVWRRVVDWPAHGRWVPLTRVSVLTADAEGVGARFVGRTGFGRIGFDDPMEVVEWQPPAGADPGHCAVLKQGRVLSGGARFEVRPTGAGTTVVSWTEDVQLAAAERIAPLGWALRLVDPLVVAVGRRGLARVLSKLARDVEAGVGG